MNTTMNALTTTVVSDSKIATVEKVEGVEVVDTLDTLDTLNETKTETVQSETKDDTCEYQNAYTRKRHTGGVRVAKQPALVLRNFTLLSDADMDTPVRNEDGSVNFEGAVNLLSASFRANSCIDPVENPFVSELFGCTLKFMEYWAGRIHQAATQHLPALTKAGRDTPFNRMRVDPFYRYKASVGDDVHEYAVHTILYGALVGDVNDQRCQASEWVQRNKSVFQWFPEPFRALQMWAYHVYHVYVMDHSVANSPEMWFVVCADEPTKHIPLWHRGNILPRGMVKPRVLSEEERNVQQLGGRIRKPRANRAANHHVKRDAK